MTQANLLLLKNLINSLIQGSVGRLLILFGFFSFMLLAFYPFEWDPPKKFMNGAKFLENGNVEFRQPGILYAKNPPPWIEAAKDSGTIFLELKIRPFTVSQRGPARILTLSKDQTAQNFMVGQTDRNLVIRLIRSNNISIYRPRTLVFIVEGVLKADEWRHITISVERSLMEVFVDGKEAMEIALPSNNMLRFWRLSHTLAFGNEGMGQRPWRGEIAKAILTVGNTQYDLLRSDDLQLPQKFWSARYAPRLDSIIKLNPDRSDLYDYVANMICFIPLGLLLAARRPNKSSVLHAATICGMASLGVESTQIFFARFPSIYDLILNTCGGAVGALLAQMLSKREILALAKCGTTQAK